MNQIDWLVLFGTLIFIVTYGVWKTRGSKNIQGYLLGDKSMKWWTIGLSIMATQASAITFLSTPGQAFEDGMGFIQFYFGLPIAMIILCVTVIPIYHRLKVYTAYEFLEKRFDLKSRFLAAFLFLVQRGLAAGITIYAPAIVLSTILQWSLTQTILLIGILVTIYTVTGGTKAVSQTQKQQLAVMMGGMVVAFVMLLNYLPEDLGFTGALQVAGKMDRLNIIDLEFNPSERYNVWSGILGGVFLFASYFGTDQSQVQRYLSGKSVGESRMGLIFNGLLKIPMQFFILLIGVMVFVFYQFHQPPVFFNEAARLKLEQSSYADELAAVESRHSQVFEEKQVALREMMDAIAADDEAGTAAQRAKVLNLEQENRKLRTEVGGLMLQADPNAEVNDTDYVFLTFVMNHLPHGLIGLLLAVIFSAAMSSTASELNALASTATVDFYKRALKPQASDRHYLMASKLLTVFWGALAMSFALFASLFDNLIQAVNILGSVFYGPILGIFFVAFSFKFIKGNAVFIAAILSEIVIVYLYLTSDIAFLWYNPIGCLLVLLFSSIIQILSLQTKK